MHGNWFQAETFCLVKVLSKGQFVPHRSNSNHFILFHSAVPLNTPLRYHKTYSVRLDTDVKNLGTVLRVVAHGVYSHLSAGCLFFFNEILFNIIKQIIISYLISNIFDIYGPAMVSL